MALRSASVAVSFGVPGACGEAGPPATGAGPPALPNPLCGEAFESGRARGGGNGGTAACEPRGSPMRVSSIWLPLGVPVCELLRPVTMCAVGSSPSSGA